MRSTVLCLCACLFLGAGCRLTDFDEDGVLAADDCDDFDATVYPGAPEVCDGLDNDCDEEIDEDLELRTVYVDADDDGFGVESLPEEACGALLGYSTIAGDCNDADPEINPLADEMCDAVDRNCDGDPTADSVDAPVWYPDFDDDGFGSGGFTTVSCTQPGGFVDNDDDCDDGDEFQHPGADEVCNGEDTDCDGTPDSPDPIDGDVVYLDTDDDGFGEESESILACGVPAGYADEFGDCDPDDGLTYPGADEPCGGPDRNCDEVEPYLCASCLEQLDASQTDGVYSIDVDGEGGLDAFDVYCDMTTDGGGWTMVQRTVWEWADSGDLVTGYTTWYEDTIGDPGSGAYRLAGTYWQELAASDEHLSVNALRTTTGGACDPLYYKMTGGAYDIDENNANISGATGSPDFILGTKLIATDTSPVRCGSTSTSVGWFYTSGGTCCTMCPTFQGSLWADEPHPSLSLSAVSDLFGNTRDDVCNGATPMETVNPTNFRGVDVMEYYVR